MKLALLTAGLLPCGEGCNDLIHLGLFAVSVANRAEASQLLSHSDFVMASDEPVGNAQSLRQPIREGAFSITLALKFFDFICCVIEAYYSDI